MLKKPCQISDSSYKNYDSSASWRILRPSSCTLKSSSFVASTVSHRKPAKAQRKDTTPAKKQLNTTSPCTPHSGPTNSSTIVKPIKKLHSVSKPIDKLARRPRDRR